MTEVERIALEEVRDLIVVGEPLPFPVFDAGGRLLLNMQQMVGSERQFEQLVERGAWVERPKVEEARRQRAEQASLSQIVAQRQLTLFDHWSQLVADLDLHNRALGRGAGRVEDLHPLVDRLLALLARDADAAIYFCVRQDSKRTQAYAATHPVHCAVIAALAAQSLSWPAARASSLVGAALTMNASFIELQNQLAEERDPPTKKQMEQIRAHPHASAGLLRQAGVSDALWLQLVEDHHERGDGQGYPRGASDCDDAALLLRLVDVYSAKISPRRIRPALSPQVSAQQLFQQHGKLPRDGPLAMAMIRSLGGAHPPGALVQLKSGEVAVVARRPKAGTAPTVATLSNPRGEPVVATLMRDTAVAEFAISGALQDSSRFQRILPERVYGMLLAE